MNDTKPNVTILSLARKAIDSAIHDRPQDPKSLFNQFTATLPMSRYHCAPNYHQNGQECEGCSLAITDDIAVEFYNWKKAK